MDRDKIGFAFLTVCMWLAGPLGAILFCGPIYVVVITDVHWRPNLLYFLLGGVLLFLALAASKWRHFVFAKRMYWETQNRKNNYWFKM